MAKTWRKVRRSNADDTFKKPPLTTKRGQQALRAQIKEEQEEAHGNH